MPKNETHRETFARWLEDSETWIGIFENKNLDHSMRGARIAIPFDVSQFSQAEVGNTKAPDVKGILGHHYTLVAKCQDIDSTLEALAGEAHASQS